MQIDFTPLYGRNGWWNEIISIPHRKQFLNEEKVYCKNELAKFYATISDYDRKIVLDKRYEFLLLFIKNNPLLLKPNHEKILCSLTQKPQ